LLINKHKQTALNVDMVTIENDEDKRLITGEVLNDSKDYKKGQTVIFGRYAIFQVTIQGVDYYLLDENDVIATTNYKEN
jgi:co-chaperonin GroES (HSP10)